MSTIIPAQPPFLAQLGALVRQLRNQAGLAMRVLAERSGLSPRFLSELEAGRANISVGRLAHLARSLGRSAGELLVEAERRGAETRKPGSPIALLGLRGAGKTTVGARLAKRLDVPFFELDERIESTTGLSLAEIFALEGEPYYRRLEVQVLRDFLDSGESAVLATGGGIVTNEEALRLLEGQAVTVWLRAEPDDHWTRVVAQGDLRPMAGRTAARIELRKLLASREKLYRKARIKIDTSRLGIDESVREIEKKLSARNGRVQAAKVPG